jgi:hypothetical protein
MKSKLDQALDHMWEQIKKGVEYPSAHENTCVKFELSYAEGRKLQQKYDKC